MPVEFLSDEQAAAYGRFVGPPTQEQLERFFWLDDSDRDRVGRRRRDTTMLGFAVQLGTVRFLGTFLDDPVDVPWAVVAFVAGQLGVADASCVKDYAANEDHIGKRINPRRAERPIPPDRAARAAGPTCPSMSAAVGHDLDPGARTVTALLTTEIAHPLREPTVRPNTFAPQCHVVLHSPRAAYSDA